jgi:phage antirepressor YoqD-like protein
MIKHTIYKGKKVYNSKQVRALLNIEFDLILQLFYENRERFKDGRDYFYVDRVLFSKLTGEEIKGTSKMIYLWTTEGIEIIKDLLDGERQLTFDDLPKIQSEAKKEKNKVTKVDELDIYVPAEGLDVGDVARALQSKGIINFGQNTLFRKLRNRGVLNSYNIPYQQYIKNNMFGVYVQEKKNGKGEYIKCKVFEKGIRKIAEWFAIDGDDINGNNGY